jgi:hypothetical protein
MKRIVTNAMMLMLTCLMPFPGLCEANKSTPVSTGSTNTSPVEERASWKIVKQNSHVTVRVAPQVDMTQYSSIQLEGVRYTGIDDELNPEEAEKLVTRLRECMEKELAAVKLDGKLPGGHELQTNVKITRIKRSNPALNAVALVTVKVPVDMGDAYVTTELTDARTGEVVGEIVTAGHGQVYQAISSLSSLGQSKVALKKESHTIAQELEHLTNNAAKHQPGEEAKND